MADETQLAVQNQASDAIAMIERLMSSPSFDVNKMEHALRIRAEEEARWNARQYAEAFANVTAELPIVWRAKKNSHTNTTYADLVGVNEAIMPILSRHGFGVSFTEDVDRSTAELVAMRCTLLHRCGHATEGRFLAPIDSAGKDGKVNKTPIQARGSAMSYARRYMLLNLLNITVSDEDNDGAPVGRGDEGLTDTQVNEVETLLTQSKASREAFLQHVKVAAVYKIKQRDFKSVCDKLRQKIAANSQPTEATVE